MCETRQYVCIRDVIFTSSLSKGAKLFYGALDRLPAYVEDPRQQELALELPPSVVKVVSYDPSALAGYMQCGVATVRRYVKELTTAGWITWHESKSRGKNRKLIIRLDEAKQPAVVPPKLKNPIDDTPQTPELFAAVEPPVTLHPDEAFALSPLIPPLEVSATVPSEAEHQTGEQPATGPGHIRVPDHCLRTPLLAEDLAIVEHCVNEPDNLDIQGYNKTLNAYLTHLWTTQQENAFERGRKMVQIWLELRRKHNKPCHGDAVFSNNLPTAAYYASL